MSKELDVHSSYDRYSERVHEALLSSHSEHNWPSDFAPTVVRWWLWIALAYHIDLIYEARCHDATSLYWPKQYDAYYRE